MPYDVYDVDAHAGPRRTAVGLLAYKAVIWEPGDDLLCPFARPAEAVQAQRCLLFDQEIVREAPPREQRPQALDQYAGKFTKLQGSHGTRYPSTTPSARHRRTPLQPDQTQGNGDADDPATARFNCVSGRVQRLPAEYWLGAYLQVNSSSRQPGRGVADDDRGAGLLGTTQFSLNGDDVRRQNQATYYSFPDDDVEHPAPNLDAPQFAHSEAGDQAATGRRAYDQPTGGYYTVARQRAAYQRLTPYRRPDRTAVGSLSFKLSYDTEPDFDYVLVEAHTVGQDDSTTLPDGNRQHE